MLELFAVLMLVHLLYDFHWQGEFVGVMKSKSDFILHVHCLTWTLCLSAVLYFFGVFALWKLVFLYVTHFVIDYWKCRLCPEHWRLNKGLWIDQALHFITIVGVMF